MLRKCIQLKLPGSTRTWLLCLLVVLQIVLFVRLVSEKDPSFPYGYLLKVGSRFVVAMKDPAEPYTYHMFSYVSLADALRFLSAELKMKEGRAGGYRLKLDYINLVDRFSSTIVLWKAAGYPILNRLSFLDPSEAAYFAEAFKRGSYSPSPFGHSLIFSDQSPQ